MVNEENKDKDEKEAVLDKDNRKWYKKKRFIIPAILVGFLLFGSGDAPSQSQIQGVKDSTPAIEGQVDTAEQLEGDLKLLQEQVEQQQKENQPTFNSAVEEKKVPLSNDNYYINSEGNKVHSPAYAPSVPPGASARCRDGTYSFSQSRRGTCSHHGGVGEWLR